MVLLALLALAVTSEFGLAQRGGRGKVKLPPERQTSIEARRETFEERREDFVRVPLDLVQEQLLRAPPGERPRVAFLLDPQSSFGPGLREMRTAWRGQPETHLAAGTIGLATFLRENRHKTVLIIGHIERGNFVRHDFRGAVSARWPINTLLQQARESKVLLIAIGCNSAEFDAPVGFTGNITTDAVAMGLTRIARGTTTLLDLLTALQGVGDIKIDTSLILIASEIYIEISLVDAVTGDKVIEFSVDPKTLTTVSNREATTGGGVIAFLVLSFFLWVIGSLIWSGISALARLPEREDDAGDNGRRGFNRNWR